MDKILAVIHREMLHARSKKVDEFREVNKNLNKCELLDSILKFVNFCDRACTGCPNKQAHDA